MKKETGIMVPKISIIVPVYNVQKYLKKCLNSILRQTFTEFEVICINDGSTDNSLAILRDFAAKDSRIIVINKKKGGVSAARNAGLKKASGEYITFVDGDDWIEPETYAEAYAKIIQDHSDMVVFNFQDILAKNKVKISDKLSAVPADRPFRFKECPDDFFYTGTSVWGHLFRRQPNIKFKAHLKKGGDSVYFWEYCLQYNPQISVLNKVFYNYLRRDGSIMKNAELVKSCEVVKSAKALAAQSCFQKASKRTQSRILDRIAASLSYEIKHESTVLSDDYFAQIREFMDLFNRYSRLGNLRYYQKLSDVVAVYSRKIDLVYLWVNSNDEKWREQKKYWAEQCGIKADNDDNQDCRFVDNQELRYSLRSAQKFAPWINKIFIVTNGQVPEWLDASHPKIKIITHDQIMPEDALPTFNAIAIEACLANIPELSEYFLFANDDFFFGAPLKPNYFFNAEGKPIIRMIKHKWSPETIQNMLYKNIVYFSKELVRKKMHIDYGNIACIHNVVPYRKSMFAACAELFADEFNRTAHCKFREKNMVQRTIVTYYTLAKMKIKPEIIGIHAKDKEAKAIFMHLTKASDILRRLQLTRPKLFCINDHEAAADKDRERLKKLLAALFPAQQPWEKDYGADVGLLSNNFILNNIRASDIGAENKPEPTKESTLIKERESAENLKQTTESQPQPREDIFYFCGLPLLKIARDSAVGHAYLFKFIPLGKTTYRK